jgi:hypothetical protein
MARRWVTAWKLDLEDWTDIALDEPSVLTEPEARDLSFEMSEDEPGRRRLRLWRPFVVRCAPGKWQVDAYLSGDVVLETRLRRPDHPRRRWSWADIEAGREKRHDGSLWGHGDLHGGTFSFVQLAAADQYLRENDVPRSSLITGSPAGLDRLPGRDHPLAYEVLGGAALTIIQTMGDVPFLVATQVHGAPGELELGWGLRAEFW